MGSKLQQVLRSFCFNTDWDYAVFWKLKHQSKLLITWEDVYYESKKYQDKNRFNETAVSSNGGHYSHDPLGLPLAKMSCQVFSLGEGMIGQVAVSGKHLWIFSDNCIANPSSISECSDDGWQSQFAAGIKTVAVVAVLPHGVVQLGSLQKISEDIKMVDHVRNVISEMHASSPGSMSCLLYNNLEDICFSNMCTRNGSAGFNEDESHFSWSQFFSPALGDCSDKTPKTNAMHERAEDSVSGIEISVPSSSEGILTRQLGKTKSESVSDTNFGKTAKAFTSENVDHQEEFNNLQELQNMQLHHHFEKLEVPIKSNHVEISASPLCLCPGYELYEALGHTFDKHNGCVWDNSGPYMAIEISEGVEPARSLLMENSDSHLLDAVVAKASHKGGVSERSDKPFHEASKSQLRSAENTPCTSFVTVSSACYSFDHETSASLNSVKCGVESLKGFSPASSSRGSAQSTKTSKKRARPGERSRPRPRDRQLIQDRLKELRELVPNGSKCSIDSLLERTIKHMVFLQGVTKHADKLNKCSASKLLNKETSLQRFSCGKQGSSWAVEVGNNRKVCPIIVENINMNGQMLIEMLCEEFNQFLDVAETIRSLGLSVIKGISEMCGSKTRMCFLVENNRSMHRMDILWSLMQLVQPTTTN